MKNDRRRPHGDTTRVPTPRAQQYSGRPSEWLLRRIGAPGELPASTKSPRAQHDVNHHQRPQTIEGALEIAHSGPFISTERHTPEELQDPLLGHRISEEQHREIDRARANLRIPDYRMATTSCFGGASALASTIALTASRVSCWCCSHSRHQARDRAPATFTTICASLTARPSPSSPTGTPSGATAAVGKWLPAAATITADCIAGAWTETARRRCRRRIPQSSGAGAHRRVAGPATA